MFSYLSEDERAELDMLLQETPAATLLDWFREDPARILLRAGLEPDPWQANLLRSTHQEILLLCARQAGKTTAAAALILRQALLVPDSLVLILSPGHRQSQELLRDKVLRLYDALGKPVAARRRMETSLELANRSRVIALPDNPSGIVGYSSVNLLIIDEAARVPDELYLTVRPMLTVSRGSIVALSTPYGQRGFFYNAWEKEEGWARYAVTADQCPRHDKEFLARERLRQGERWFQQDFYLTFNDAVDQVFSADVIRQAMSQPVEPLFGAQS